MVAPLTRWYCPRCGDKMDPKFQATHKWICAMVERLYGNADDVDRVFP